MYDASKKAEENIEETRLVVKKAHAVGVSVKLNLAGSAARRGVGRPAPARIFHQSRQAERFVAENGWTPRGGGGNAHGFYDGAPNSISTHCDSGEERASRLSCTADRYTDDDFRRAVSSGIRKINFFTEMSKLAADRVRELIRASDEYLLHDLVLEAKNRIREVVMERIRVFGSENACGLPGAQCRSAGTCTAKHTSGSDCATARVESAASPSAPPEVAGTDIHALVAKVVADVLRDMRR